VPFIGFVLTIIAGLIFFFIYQEVAVGKSSFANALRNSYRIFMNNKLDTLLTFIIAGIFALIIILIFAIPLIVVGIMSLVSAVSTGAFMQAFISNLGLFIITGIILIIGVAFSTLFSNSINTDVYMQLKKKR
jgi:hypothetical protein